MPRRGFRGPHAGRRGTGRVRAPELVNGRERDDSGHAGGEGLGPYSRPALYPAGRDERNQGRPPRPDRGGQSVRGSGPRGPDDQDQKCSLYGDRRPCSQGTVGPGPGPGRYDSHSGDHGPEEALRDPVSRDGANHHGQGKKRRRPAGGRKTDNGAAPGSGTASARSRTTISRCGTLPSSCRREKSPRRS